MQKMTKELLNNITQLVVEGVHPERIFPFGSYAWGVPNKYSDIDLFVIGAVWFRFGILTVIFSLRRLYLATAR